MNQKLKIIFMGSDDSALYVLKLLHSNQRLIINSVYTREPKISGRGLKMKKTAVHELALQYKIPTHTPKSLKNLSLEGHIDLAVVFSYGLIVPRHFLNYPQFGFINIHPSLLPKWRGPSPMIYPLLYGEKETGVTIMKMDVGMDTGDILTQGKIKIADDDNCQSLVKKLVNLSGDLLIKTIFDYVDGKIIPQKQDNNLATYTKKIDSTFLQLDFNDNCQNIMGKIRAFSPKPGAFCKFKGKRLKILQASYKNIENESRNGTMVDNNFSIKCADGLILPEVVQLEGKKQMHIRDFVNGFNFHVGDFIDSIS